jgi:hypothetical protein
MGEDPCEGVDQDQVRAALDYLTLKLKDPSVNLDQALGEVSKVVGSAAVAACVKQRHDERAASLKRIQTTGWVEDLELESWYTGSHPSDKFWPDLRGILSGQGWSDDSLERLNDASTGIVARLASPSGGQSKRLGLVIGHVQSGKTTNFTSVIAKAADAGYRLFIVLSGMSNALRAQTQARLESQLIAPNESSWYRLTDPDSVKPNGGVLSGDFRGDADITALLGSNATDIKSLGVIKKNGARLKRLVEWLEGASEQILMNCPVLIIDDESDQASINTSRDEDRPTAINERVRQLVDLLPKVSYVGYTATPFANVLIDPEIEQDLYPRHFIRSLERPEGHFGPETLFGREALDRDAVGAPPEETGLDMIREVPDEETEFLRPAGNDLDEFSPDLTDSLREAIRWFWLSTAARRVRNSGEQHATMLIHTSMRIHVHGQFRLLVETELASSIAALEECDERFMRELEQQWLDETPRVQADKWGYSPVLFEQVCEMLGSVLSDTHVIEENGPSEDRLDYTQGPRTVIVVGGNTVARGLTLEGLCSSFFVRSAGAYDTLLQMGRWFGFRKGYEDLPRIWMTAELNEWFHHLATVEQEIRYDVERYESEGLTPLEFGPRLRTHPALAITAASKMRAAIPAQVSYSGRRLQTILFNHRDDAWLQQNIDASQTLISAGRSFGVETEHIVERGHWILRGLPAAAVLEFVRNYQFHPDSRELQSDLIARYIEAQVDNGELNRWSVAVLGLPREKSELGSIDLGLDRRVNLINRSRLPLGSVSHANIKALMSKRDRMADFPKVADQIENLKAGQLESLRNSPSAETEAGGPVRRPGMGDDSGLIALYPISKDSTPRQESPNRDALHSVEHVIGVGLVFPEAKSDEGTQSYMTADLSSQILEETTEEDFPEDHIEDPPEPDAE